MTSLAPAGHYTESLRELLAAVGTESVMDLDAEKESNFVARDRRRRGPAPRSELGRWAVLDNHGVVVGYLSGRFGGGLPSRELPAGHIGGFISMIVIAAEARGGGHGWRAIQEFAVLASQEQGTTLVGLHLDETGDVAGRRAGFQRMGFEFEGLLGVASVDALLAGAPKGVVDEPGCRRDPRR